MGKTAYITEPVRGNLQSFAITISVLLPASLLPGMIVGLAFRCSLYAFSLCLVIFGLGMWFFFWGQGADKRLYRGARDGMAIWPLLKYAVQSIEYAPPTGETTVIFYYMDR